MLRNSVQLNYIVTKAVGRECSLLLRERWKHAESRDGRGGKPKALPEAPGSLLSASFWGYSYQRSFKSLFLRMLLLLPDY